MMLFRVAILVATLNMAAAVTLRDAILDRPDLTRFRQALNALNLLDEVLDDETQAFTVFAPSDSAIDDDFLFNYYFTGVDNKPFPKWHIHLQSSIHNTIVPGSGLKRDQIFNNQISELQSLQDPLLISQFLGLVGGAPIETADIVTSNGVLHVTSGIMEPAFYKHTFADLELQHEFGPDDKGRVSLVDVVDLSESRNEFSRIREDGTTMVGCRTRAFNRMGLDYLTQTINYSNDVKFGELMNATRVNETYDEMTYSLLPKNYYVEDIPVGFFELTMPVNKCANMWVSKHDGVMVFNNGRTVETPIQRKFLSSNGPGYVVDKCQVCPGVAMLTAYAGDWTPFDTIATSQFFRASEWNLRDLRQSVGSGGDVTLFAPILQAWGFLNIEDITRLGTPKWQPHQWDLLGNMLVEGVWREQDLKDKYLIDNKPYNLTSIIGQIIPIDYDAARDLILVNGGDLFFSNIKGVDGYAHFVTEATRPFSMVETVYDIAKKRPDLSFHTTLIDTVGLDDDMKTLLPLTAIYVPNQGWAGTTIELADIAPVVLESHIFKELLWCDDLRTRAGERIESQNGDSWLIATNEENFPCLVTEPIFGGPTKMSCLTECDILAKNGIVHIMDKLLVYEGSGEDVVFNPEEFAVPTAPSTGPPPSEPTFQRPTPAPPTNSGGFPSSFNRPTSASSSVFDAYDGNNGGKESSGASRQMGVWMLAGVLSFILALQL